ncbi:MmcQ/YjbR family DNA-binding protein [Sharpea porci]|uniref:MmcQ/YjbR family DNA-binding protein n=1 Tax=Sharpea porci TaxID=2652286 RepID=UPI002DDB52A9|nr:MmcQ/YjbR family DNA-binding protein [Sharpea porci]
MTSYPWQSEPHGLARGSSQHMNKKNWVSIILDDTLEDSRIEELLQQSYLLTKSSKK